MMGPFGPDLGGVALVPCILGSCIVVFVLSLASHGFKRSRA
jgi:uncharacterized membrane protein YeaQ/YmgE (transglycosylase-associated protein family)